MKARLVALLASCTILSLTAARAADQADPPHNLIIFVADGLRSHIVTDETAPTIASLRREGVDFANSHSVYPTLTTANASAIATGHQLGDTGDFANSIYTGFPVQAQGGSPTPFLENDAVLAELGTAFGGNFLNETSVLDAAAKAGYSTAAIGKLGPVAIQALGGTTIIVDDATGHGGIPTGDGFVHAMTAAGLPAQAPGRGANGAAGDWRTPGTTTANVDQIAWFTRVASDVLLPRFSREGKPFAMVFWSRDPDGTQHNQGDSLGSLVPGINGPTSLAAIRNADMSLAALRAALERLGLAKTTNILVIADHGFSTISREGAGSASAVHRYADVAPGMLPPGFAAIDLAHDLGLALFDADTGRAVDPAAGEHPKAGNALLGPDPAHPQAIVAANGGTDLIYLTGSDKAATAAKIVAALEARSYVSSIFVADALGALPGTLPMSAINLEGSATTPHPDIVVGFASRSTGCADPELCSAQISDTMLQQGQGMHGSFSRADTHNFMAAIGPDFKSHYVDAMPSSNADIGATAARLLRLDIAPRGHLAGRVLDEALTSGAEGPVEQGTLCAVPAPGGFATRLDFQRAGGVTYLDAAGTKQRTVGLSDGERCEP